MIKEVCVENFSEALRAQSLGASRIELCENLHVGGTTPSYGTIVLCKKYLKIPLFVMIRPRGGNFVYNDLELEIMKNDIEICKKLGVDGVVFGILDKNNRVNTAHVRELCELAEGMSITFHKAIDHCTSPIEALRHIKMIGMIDRVLSSGGKESALEGKEILNKMIHFSQQAPLIVVAGKVTNENIDQIKDQIPSKEYHGRKIVGSIE
ncbi:MAG: copper homeostasis protein CutC [Prolixibacteraceae bacterium]|jgi:copper homeostasis protein|nr:copper homeostasis protein CutC [Prolixibacteraceae bacterium]